ncbi:prepilin-type N-terminal cleavage/methylation domain-containing protein [Gilvimarinus sp. SDUM040013]|uniref:Prepilin-type N-terminal cleavage/methylation domain-containing protein n=1 Tax=Gilvimarinus gilvus TaxID=3058038 RepID=A0ABU4S014_9GAMM|nr:prepilin-type N-terminal cleavage/methylation domain-containing protein [Gilvimarinus sp. SDUM040013]MDO3386042.1 prepilin-type N-terminal cleavage/methylation domain-containing protein [Gilvimarinus sp. SDUM040013]MDX6850495.1 prepilin-type N-terminal cleavage/methylation domain-containing protein [Gilvimarinus sp. SDUM040013]
MIQYFRSKGFTMIELTAALAVLGLIALFAIPKIEEEWAERIVNNAASQVHDVLTAARRHRLDTQAWPNNVGALVTGGYLSSGMAAAPLGGSYTFNQVGDDFEVQFSAAQSVYANRLLARLPYARRIGVANVATVIPIPGHEVSYAALDDKYYHRDGSRELTGTFAGGDQDAVNLRNIEMTMLTDRDDITKVLDPSDLSIIHNMEANRVDANNVVADHTETGALNLLQMAGDGDRCNSLSGNIAINEDDRRSLLVCYMGRWMAKEESRLIALSPRILVQRRGYQSGQLNSTYGGSYLDDARVALVTARCELAGSHNSVFTIHAAGSLLLSVKHAGDSGHSDSAFGMTLANVTNGRIRLTSNTSHDHPCEDGFIVHVVGYST